MASYENANAKAGRLFRASEEDLKKKRPLLNGPIVIDGILLYAGVYLKKGAEGKSDYYTLTLQYPKDEEARLKATGPATSAAAKKEAEWDANHPRTVQDNQRKAEYRAEQRSQSQEPQAPQEEFPF